MTFVLSICWVRSLVNNRNRIGPRTDPCTTPKCHRYEINGDTVLLGLGWPSIASCQLALYSNAGQITCHLPTSNTLPLCQEPNVLTTRPHGGYYFTNDSRCCHAVKYLIVSPVWCPMLCCVGDVSPIIWYLSASRISHCVAVVSILSPSRCCHQLFLFYLFISPLPHGIMFSTFTEGLPLLQGYRCCAGAQPTPGYHIWEAHSEARDTPGNEPGPSRLPDKRSPN